MGYTTLLANIVVELVNQTDWKVLIFSTREDYKLNNISDLYQIIGASELYDLESPSSDVIKIRSTRYDNLDTFSVLDNLALVNKDVSEIHKLEVQFKEFAKEYDLVVMELGHVDEYKDKFSQLSNEFVTVTTTEKDARAKCYSLIKNAFDETGKIDVKLLVNMASSAAECSQVGEGIQKVVKQFLEKDIELLGSVPMSADVSTAGRHASPFVEKFPDSDVAVSVRHVVTKLQENHEEYKTTLVKLGALLVRQLA
jgi:flagellar biosynthesis protein FlhG